MGHLLRFLRRGAPEVVGRKLRKGRVAEQPTPDLRGERSPTGEELREIGAGYAQFLSAFGDGQVAPTEQRANAVATEEVCRSGRRET